MTPPFFFWILLAVLIFWALGAYNRLVRLRAAVINTFAGIENRLNHALALVAERISLQMSHLAAPADGSEDMALRPSEPELLEGLRGAAAQLEVALRVARRSPLDGLSVAALRTASATLQTAWERLQPDPAHPALAPNQRAWEDHWQATREAVATFNASVYGHNRAIAQFPAGVLAYFFGFRAAEDL
jgi:LemA protein